MEHQLLGYEETLYRLDQAEHIAGKLDRAPQNLRIRRNLMTRPPEQIRPYLRRVGFEYEAYMLRLRIDDDPVSGCIGGWEQYHHGRTIEDFFYGELEQDPAEQRLLRYMKGYIIQLIGSILFPDASDSRVYIRWFPLLEDLEACGRLSWGSAVLAWLYRQMCHATEHGQRNLGDCISLLLSWAYHYIPLLRPGGFDTHRFPLVERWVQYLPNNARGEGRLRHCRRTLNRTGLLNVEWTPYADPQLHGLIPPTTAKAEASGVVVFPLLCFAIVEWHQVDWVVRQFGGLQHIPTWPLNIDDIHRMDGRFGRGE
ncbi:hypothetical protein Ahy_B08g093346 [Arachis hypogaea]|uniref:Aminotransferase-like plant mobile domain-containing protein n=1 Tax=Arachis hypogaea TaxID=3818 RepID=A0A444Y5W5_ARAHY|nr:hypothetical protein Ahy_B08g093346 [Arachis hypogaea]